jgi:hypothetical protein
MSDSGSIEVSDSITVGPNVTEKEKAFSQVRRDRMPVNGLEVVQMLLAKSNVHGIIWNQYSDRDEHTYPNAGLIAPSGKHRSLLDGLARLRQLHIH